MAKSIYSAGQERLQALLRQVRVEANLTQMDLASRLRKPQSFVSKYEAGERRLDLVELEQICKEIGVDLVKFVERFSKAKR
jgi:transcriptional regulator with XRE-family HTH domain